MFLTLEQQSQFHNITLSSIADFAYIFDRFGRFAFVNQALLDLWGLQLEDAVGKNFYELKYPHNLAERLQQQIQKVIETRVGITDETEYTSPTGAGGCYEYKFGPVLDSEGNVEFVAGSTRDVTERKRAEAEIRQSERRLRNLAKALENQVQARTKELENRTNDMLLQSDGLRELSMRLMKARDEEGRRIARELHDSTGQTITALSMSLGQITRELGAASPKASEMVDGAKTLLKELDQEIRTTSYLLHPPMLDELGLPQALAWYVEGLQKRAGIEVLVSMEEFDRLPSEIEIIIFRVIQECLTNIHRHSGSKCGQINITSDSMGVTIEVRDFGKGISKENLDAIRNRGVGVGLRGMRERVRPFAGDVRIDSELGVSTTITITLPHKLPA